MPASNDRPDPGWIRLYGLIGRAAGPLIRRHLEDRRARGKEHDTRWPERLGAPSAARPEGRLVWLHAASLGEAVSALPLIERLKHDRPDLTPLITTGTVTSAALMAERLPAGALHQFVPVDLPDAVDRFLDHWRPDLALWFESELWPNLISRTRRRGVPILLINGRMSERSFARWRRVAPLARSLLGNFTAGFAQSALDADRYRALGLGQVSTVGNLKLAADPLPVDEAALDEVLAALAGRPVWLAASTHPGEEAIVTEAHLRLAAKRPNLVTLIVPRHPERGPGIADELARDGLTVALRSRGDALPAPGGIYIADTIGELGLWYRAAPIVLMGKSLAAQGGQNLAEPARLGATLLSGPHLGNFAEIAAELTAAGNLTIVEDAASLAAAVDVLLDRPRAEASALGQADALDRVMEGLAPFLP